MGEPRLTDEWADYGHGDRLARAIGVELPRDSGAGRGAPVDLKILADEVVVAFPNTPLDSEDGGADEIGALAAVFAAESPRGRELLGESYFHPGRFYLDEREDDGEFGEPAGEGPIRLVVDASPTFDDEELYERVGALVVPDERAAAGEISRRVLEIGERERDQRRRREASSRKESRVGESRLERLRTEIRAAASKRPALSTGQLEENMQKAGRGGAKKRGFFARTILGVLASFGLVSLDEEEAERFEGPTWRRRIPGRAAELIVRSPFPGVAVITNNKGGTGKCVTFDTKLTDPVTGLRHTIEEFVERPDLRRVHTLEDRRTTSAIRITEKVDSGVKPTLRVRLKSGRSITVTRHHPLLMPDGWRKTEDIKVGETVALAAREPFPEEVVPLPDAEVDLLAAMLAEGGTTSSTSTFTSADNGMVALVSAAAGDLGMKVGPKRGVRYQYRLSNLDRYERDLSRRGKVRAFLDRHDMDGVLAKHKRVPEAVYRLGPDQLGRFLAVFWMCDGYIDRCTGPGLTLASEGLVEDIQHLLLRFGIQSGVAHKKAAYATTEGERREFDAWRLTVYSQHRRRFRDSIPLWGEKREKLDDLCEKPHNPNTGSPTMTDKLKRELREAAFGSPDKRARGGAGHVPGGARSRGGNFATALLEAPPSTRDVKEKLGWSAFQFDFLENKKKGRRNEPGTIARKPFEAFCEVFGLEERYGWLLDSLSGGSDVFWDEVVCVEDAGEQRVYDLMVEPTRCFVAADVIVHNTTVATNLAVAAARVARPKGWDEGLPVLLVEQNYGNSDIRDRIKTPGAIGRGLTGFVEDFRAGRNPEIADYVTPVSGFGNLDALLISDRDDEHEHAGTITETDLDALYESAADYYRLIVVDLDKGLPQEVTMVADVLRFWLTVSDVTYLIHDASKDSLKAALKVAQGARNFFAHEAATGGEPRPLVPVRNKWREGEERWGASADDPEEWERWVSLLGADWAVDRDGRRVSFLKIPDDPQCDAFSRQQRQIALADWDFALAFEELSREWIDRVVKSRLAQEEQEAAEADGE